MIREVRKTDLSREELDSLRKIAKAESRGLPAPTTGHETVRKLRAMGLISHKSTGLSDKPSKLDQYNATRRGRRLLKSGVV